MVVPPDTLQPDALWNLGQQAQPPAADSQDAQTVHIAGVDELEGEDDIAITTDDDGNVTVDLSPRVTEPEGPEGHFDNLALRMDDTDGSISALGSSLCEAIDADERSRSDWLAIRAKGLELLALRLENPTGSTGNSSAPLEGMSTVRHPVLLEAVITAWANARGELLPANGPVKVSDSGRRSPDRDSLAEALQKDLNYYLTKRAREYYPDTDRMLLMTVFGGSGFKKVYRDPMRRRPVIESIDAQDLIVNNAATDLRNAGRVTHRIKMRPAVMKRMMHLKVYRDVELGPAQPSDTVVDLKEAQIEGVNLTMQRSEDQDYTLYECYCELDLDQFAPPHLKGKGLLLPYRVTIDKDSQQVLELRRNWDEDDEDCLAKPTFVHYPYIRGFGLYGWGLLHLLGNSAQALTAAWREALDAGMFANFPGFLIAKIGARQQTNELRVPAGGGIPIETGGQPISQVAMPLPYKDVTPGLIQMMDKVQEAARRVGAIAEVKVGEGAQEAPVGTTIAMLEQATKVESAVHKNMFQAQAEEFELLMELFREDPDAMWRGNKRPAGKWDRDSFLAAIDTYGIVPTADPNTPSHIHRVMKAVALKQLQAANPALYNSRKVDEQILRVIGWENPESLFAPAQPPMAPPPDPKMMKVQFEAEARQKDLQLRAAIEDAKLADREKDRETKKQLAVIDLAEAMAVHPESEGIVTRTLSGTEKRVQ